MSSKEEPTTFAISSRGLTLVLVDEDIVGFDFRNKLKFIKEMKSYQLITI